MQFALISGSIQVVPLVVAVVVGVTGSIVVMSLSFRSRNRLRSEIQRERAAQPQGTIGPSERNARQRVIVGLLLAPIAVILVVVAVVSEHSNGKVPAWASWLTAILFWGAVVAFIVRAVLNKRRRNRTP